MTFALALVLALQSPLDKPVTLKRTASVAALLKDLGTASGIPFEAIDKKSREVLIVSMENVPLKDAMRQIGWATYGTWEKTKDGYRLVRDIAGEQNAERHYRQWQSAEAAATIKKVRQRVKEGKSASDDSSRIGYVSSSALGDRLITTAFGVVDPLDTIFRDPDLECVYSTVPSPAAHSLGAAGQTILQAYNATSPSTPAAHAVLRCLYKYEVLNATIELYDAAGSFVFSSQCRSKYEPALLKHEVADEIPPEATVPLGAESKRLLPPDGKKFWQPSPDDFEAMPEVRERQRNPEKYEPLATFTTDVWREVARRKASNLVANVDDWFLYPDWASYTPKLKSAFLYAGGLNAEVQPGWLLARPSLPTPPWRHRADRAGLGSFLRSKNWNDIPTQARFAASTDVPLDDYTRSMIGAWSGHGALWGPLMWESARFVGFLTPQQVNMLQNGAQIPISSLSEGARRSIFRWATSHPYGDGTYDQLTQQPSLLFPNGLPSWGVVWNEETTNDYVFDLLYTKDGKPMQNRVNQLGLPKLLDDLIAADPSALANIKVKWMNYSRRMTKVRFAPGKEGAMVFQIWSTPEMKDFVSWNAVPDQVKQIIRAAGRG